VRERPLQLSGRLSGRGMWLALRRPCVAVGGCDESSGLCALSARRALDCRCAVRWLGVDCLVPAPRCHESYSGYGVCAYGNCI
jgi:hypothetical protein